MNTLWLTGHADDEWDETIQVGPVTLRRFGDTWHLEHACRVWPDGTQTITAPSLSAHDLVSIDPPHFEPSIACDCGTHGFIRDGRWVDAGGTPKPVSDFGPRPA